MQLRQKQAQQQFHHLNLQMKIFIQKIPDVLKIASILTRQGFEVDSIKILGENFNIPQEQQFVEVGSVKEHIFDKVKKLNCQLIIIGSHSSSGLHSFLGSTANATVNHAPCDVIRLRV